MSGRAATSEASVVPAGGSEGEKPSCQGCRKRKLKCSREVPICFNCSRLGASCSYGEKKGKPGVKVGAIESLNRRVEALESAIDSTSSYDAENAREPRSAPERSSRELYDVLSSTCVELCKLNARLVAGHADPSNRGQPYHTTGHQQYSPRRSTDEQPSDQRSHNTPSWQPRKRQRKRNSSCLDAGAQPQADCGLDSPVLPDADLLDKIVEVYFSLIQPWIPVLHKTRFIKRMQAQPCAPGLVIILHAMVAAAIWLVDPMSHGLSCSELTLRARQARSYVVLHATEYLSVENLQALIIIAFNDIGSGAESKAWSLVGSLTRTVEYLQLSVEAADHEEQKLLRPLLSLPRAQSWTEDEERRRVFWNVFNLDRFCSVFTGWNTSLTEDDVHRRLPADGGLWHQEEAVVTPYFGIWNRSVAKMGSSIAFLPTHYPGPDQNLDHQHLAESPESSSSTNAGATQSDLSTVGAFAYCIEATESLSRVTTYFLQQRVNFRDRKEVSSWLTRFKELDLRLVHWKMFLPEKWKDSNIARQPSVINMDPNLTLAHLTHNTSMILLHQRIAYPQADWGNTIKIPSSCSAETCQNAAVETQNIVEKYLKHSATEGFVTSQFAFCVFVAARVLLVHWRHYGPDLSPEFWCLVASLDDMSRAWIGPYHPELSQRGSLAGTFANNLRELYENCVADSRFSIDLSAYSTVISSGRTADSLFTGEMEPPSLTATSVARTPQQQPQSWISRPSERSAVSAQWGALDSPQDAISSMSYPNNYSKYNSTDQRPRGMSGPVLVDDGLSSDAPTDELSAISYLLLDHSFNNMDRIITLDDMMHPAGLRHPTEQLSMVDGSPSTRFRGQDYS